MLKAVRCCLWEALVPGSAGVAAFSALRALVRGVGYLPGAVLLVSARFPALAPWVVVDVGAAVAPVVAACCLAAADVAELRGPGAGYPACPARLFVPAFVVDRCHHLGLAASVVFYGDRLFRGSAN